MERSAPLSLRFARDSDPRCRYAFLCAARYYRTFTTLFCDFPFVAVVADFRLLLWVAFAIATFSRFSHRYRSIHYYNTSGG